MMERAGFSVVVANDLDGAPVFLAQSQFSLNYALERAPGIQASDIKAIRA